LDVFTFVGFCAIGIVCIPIVGAILWPLLEAVFLIIHLIEVELLGRRP